MCIRDRFTADLLPDTDAFVSHCRWMLDQGVDGLAIFGTTSEANSLTVTERKVRLEALLESGVPASKLMPGTGACSIIDAANLTAHAVSRGCGGVLMLPPFYYKAVDSDGLFASFAEVIDRVADDRLHVYLYHIPPVAQVPSGLDRSPLCFCHHADKASFSYDSDHTGNMRNGAFIYARWFCHCGVRSNRATVQHVRYPNIRRIRVFPSEFGWQIHTWDGGTHDLVIPVVLGLDLGRHFQVSLISRRGDRYIETPAADEFTVRCAFCGIVRDADQPIRDDQVCLL